MKLILFVSFILCLIAPANGQLKCKIDYYSTEEGLSHQAVTCMIKDHEGFMWFGTWDGINRFDGHNFVSYKSSAGDMSQLGSDRIDQIVEDQSNHLWILAYDKQVYRFDKRTEQFWPVSKFLHGKKIFFSKILAAANGLIWLESEKEGIFCLSQQLTGKAYSNFHKGAANGYDLTSDHINFFHEDQQQLVWIGTPAGLTCIYPISAGQYRSTKWNDPFERNGNFTSVEEDKDQLYFGKESGDLIIYNKKSKRFSHIQLAHTRINNLLRSSAGNHLYATTEDGLLIKVNLNDLAIATTRYQTGESLNSIYEDKSSNLWIEPGKAGVILFNANTRQFTSFSAKVDDHFVQNLGNRFRVFEDNTGVVWINMKGGGFGYFNPASGRIENELNTADLSNYHLPKAVFYIYYDDSGVMWLRTDERRLMKIIFRGSDFRQQLLENHPLYNTDNEVRGMMCDRQNRLWLGVKSGKLYVYNNGRLITHLFDNEPAKGLGLIYCLLQDNSGNIWMGTKSDGLYKAAPVNTSATRYHLSHFVADKNGINTLTSNQIYSLLQDKQGRIWIGSFDEGLFLAEPVAGDKINFIQTGNYFANYPKQDFRKIRHMTLDKQNNIWIGTTDGLIVLNTGNPSSKLYSYTSYTKVAGDSHSVGNNNIQFIYRDSKDRMWLATSGGGLNLAMGNDPSRSLAFRNYTTKDGLPNDYLLSCTEDHSGNLWIATENGLSKFNPSTGNFRNYDSYDGLPKVGFSEASAAKLINGNIVFGTTAGYLYFDPERIGVHRINGNLVFSNLQVNNQDVSSTLKDPAFATNINYAPDLRLNYNQNIISIDYSILDFRSNKQAFSYRLKGFDTSWHNERQFHRITYTNLPPGKYVLQIKSLSTDLYSNQPYRELAITILPPFWKTWWAYLIYLLLALIIIQIIRRTATTMIRLRNKIEIEQKLADLKLRFFTNVSHELRTPLTLIMNPLEQLALKENLSPAGAAYVEVAHKNANRMVRFVNQLLDLRKLQTNTAKLNISRVEVVSLVKQISTHFEDALNRAHIQLKISAKRKELYALIDAEKLDIVLYNLLSNAVKFTSAGKTITIVIDENESTNYFQISVIDQGPGVEENKLQEIFELYYEGDHNNQKGLKGTGIGLALAKELVEFHGGTIKASNNDYKGLTIQVQLPMGGEQVDKTGVKPANSELMRKVLQTPEQRLLKKYISTPKAIDETTPLVLLVEDNPDMNEFLKVQLSEFYRVETAFNGKEGYEKAIKLLPDLILSDIMMPVMDGIQMLDKVKNELNTSHIPVVLLSAKYSIESQLEGLSYGADAYITKPFNNEFLLGLINNLLKQRQKLFESLVQKKETVELKPKPIILTSRDEKFLKEVIRAVEEKMADPEFNIDSIAEAMAMSRTSFYKKFKSLANLTPVEFVRDMRLQRAKQYLDNGGANISEIAYEVGFSNPKYFSTCFREKYQLTPSDYLKNKNLLQIPS